MDVLEFLGAFPSGREASCGPVAAQLRQLMRRNPRTMALTMVAIAGVGFVFLLGTASATPFRGVVALHAAHSMPPNRS